MPGNDADALKKRNEELKRILQDEFGNGVKIRDLHSVETEDQDGDPIMRIWVLYETKDKQLDPDKVASVIGPLRDRIKQLSNGLDRFPILSFRIPKETVLAAG
ncbi:MAG: hypothetical protein OXC82_13280 [Rhodobacteraceae bacterium]|nr:hypothetical protein [Paracoccaceae bacterium]MCY4251392.1 hypothetical protein [Paracoccaceae bacterium]